MGTLKNWIAGRWNWVIPIAFLIWSLVLSHLAGPFYLNRSDPEYPYLLNGLNCATLEFSRIGHTDHPGTPFQLVTGIFIRVLHTAAGQGTVAEDVFARPEFYLGGSSFLLALVTFWVLLWIGGLAKRNGNDIPGGLILQSSVLLSPVLIDFPMRYNPDRMLVLIALIFAGLAYQYLFAKTVTDKRFMVLSGLIMGIGFATKFNFLPVIVIPVLMMPKLRQWVVYGIVFLVAAFLSILPIIGKFSEFRRFITGVATHDGLYGQGTEQIINWSSFGKNILLLFHLNPVFGIVLLFTLFLGVYWLIKTDLRLEKRSHLLFFGGFWLAVVIGFLMVAKHFKNYYFGPVLSLTGLAFLVTSTALKINRQGLIKTIFASILALITILSLVNDYRYRSVQLDENQLTSNYLRSVAGTDDYLLVEPTWMAGPMIENGLVYGISYVAHRHRYYEELERLYPGVVTWEGPAEPLREFRTIEQDPEAMLRSGLPVYLVTSPGRYPEGMLKRVDSLASFYGIRVRLDTLFTNPYNQERILRYRHLDSWKTLSAQSGIQAGKTILDPKQRNSGVIRFTGVEAGDYVEATVMLYDRDNEKPEIILRSLNPSLDSVFYSDNHSLFLTGTGSELLRLRARIHKKPADGVLECHVYYPGDKKIELDDFRSSHYGERQ